jgi:hypothetical protein
MLIIRNEIIAIAFLCLVGALAFHNLAHPSVDVETIEGNSSLLKYEVKDVFVGNLTQEVEINNPSNYEVTDGELFIPVIRNETARHFVALYSISSEIGPPTFLSDEYGNTYAYWNNVAIERKESLTVKMNYRVLSFGIRYLTNPSMVSDYNRGSDLYKKYTQPEELLQSDNPELVSKAQDITKGENSTLKKASKIYDFVIRHVHYSAQDEERGAMWALENKTGDCSEYSYLFVALCRAVGIPARIQVGFAFSSTSETIKDGHMWAEYYLGNYGWVPVDATWRDFNTLDRRHFVSMSSIPEIMPYANFLFSSTKDSELTDNQTVSLKPLSSDAFDGSLFPENVLTTVRRIQQAKLTMFLAESLGASLIFVSDAEKADQAIFTSQIQLQDATSQWKSNQDVAQLNATDALKTSDEALQHASMLVYKAFAVLISILIMIMLVALTVIGRYQMPREKNPLRRQSNSINHIRADMVDSVSNRNNRLKSCSQNSW